MSKKEKSSCSFELKNVFISALIGLMFYLLLSICAAIMIQRNIIPYSMVSIISKADLFLAALLSCKLSIAKGRGEAFLNCLYSSILVFTITIILTLMCSEQKFDLAGVIACLMICLSGCFLILLINNKNGKMHKRKRKRSGNYTNGNQRAKLT